MSSENSVFLGQENTSNALLNDILNQLKHIPNTTHVVNNIERLNKICVPMVGAKSPATGHWVQLDGVGGFVPAPKFSESNKFLRGDGTWQTVVTRLDPLKDDSLEYYYSSTNNTDTHAYIYMKPHTDTGNYVDTLKYSRRLSFGSSLKDTYTPGVFNDYTTLDIKTIGSTTKDVGIVFKSIIGYTSTLLGNISELTHHTYAKMPNISGTLLTDGGFTVNGPVTLNGATMIHNTTIIDDITKINGPLRVHSDMSGWNEGIRIQRSNSGYALLCLGVSNADSSSNDSWIIRSDQHNGDNIFSISYGGIAGQRQGSLWTAIDANWHLTNSLTVNDSFNIGTSYFNPNYSIYTDDDTVYHTTKLSRISFFGNNNDAHIDLIDDGNSSRFYMENLVIQPLPHPISTYALEGGQLVLGARTNQQYGDINIDNYGGQLRLWNSKVNRVFNIDFINEDASENGRAHVNAGSFYLSAYSLMVSSGVIHLGTNAMIDNNGGKLYTSAPMTSTTATPTGVDQRWYRPTFISNTAPTSNDGRDGDVWIQYS